ncbi:MAG: DNA translocase FtsK 4TM domain-containing protein, partial [bacterium]|nr:DNA translocase FtsK 4TM domain-containing protein [bacterium]
MAARSGNRSSARRKSSATASFWWGWGLLVAAGLLFLSLISYSPTDSDRIRELFARGSEVKAYNWIGKPGALAAFGLGYLLLGRWAALGVAALFGIWGWMLLRKGDWQRAFVWTAVTMVTMVWLSTALGMLGALGIVEHTTLFHHEGNFGLQAATWLVG